MWVSGECCDIVTPCCHLQPVTKNFTQTGAHLSSTAHHGCHGGSGSQQCALAVRPWCRPSELHHTQCTVLHLLHCTILAAQCCTDNCVQMYNVSCLHFMCTSLHCLVQLTVHFCCTVHCAKCATYTRALPMCTPLHRTV